MQNSQNKAIEHDVKLSKTQRKKAMLALQRMGEQLVALNDKQLGELDLPEMLIDAIHDARRINKFGARQRQMQFIGKLMRHIDMVPIQEKLDAWQQRSLNQTALSHQTEHWRERILNDTKAITEFAATYTAADIKQIRALTRNAHKEKQANKPPKSYRLLFHALHTVITAQVTLSEDTG